MQHYQHPCYVIPLLPLSLSYHVSMNATTWFPHHPSNYDTPHFDEHIITNVFVVFDDADHDGNQHTRQSLTSVLAILVVIAVDDKIKQ